MLFGGGGASLGDAKTLKRDTRGSSTITSDSAFVPFILFLTMDSDVIILHSMKLNKTRLWFVLNNEILEFLI